MSDGALVRQALRSSGGLSRATALALLAKMPTSEQQQLFPELIEAARSAHGPIGSLIYKCRSQSVGA